MHANPCHVMGRNLFVTLVCIRWLGLSNTDQVSYQLSCESDLDYNIDINILISCMLLQISMTNLLCLCFLRIRNQTLVRSWSEYSTRRAASPAVSAALLCHALPLNVNLAGTKHLTRTGLCSQLLCSCIWGRTGSYEEKRKAVLL